MTMLADFVPPNTANLHAACVVGGQAFMEGLWNFGFTLDMAFAGFTPNNSGMLRVMALGGATVLLIETASFCEVSAEQDCKIRGFGNNLHQENPFDMVF